MENTFSELSKIDCKEYLEERNGLTYLSWAWAWGLINKYCPDVNYQVDLYDGKPYLFDENLGYIVSTKVTIGGKTIPMNLPVLDGANKAMKNVPWQYDKKDYKTNSYVKVTCHPATMFDINKTIMRCLVKNLAMFGLGHYIYAGEDMPEIEDKEKDSPKVPAGFESPWKTCPICGKEHNEPRQRCKECFAKGLTF